MAGISIWQLLIVLAIVLLIFGTKRLRGMGSDVGGAVKGFKDSMKEGEAGDAAHKEPAASKLGTDAEAGAPPEQARAEASAEAKKP